MENEFKFLSLGGLYRILQEEKKELGSDYNESEKLILAFEGKTYNREVFLSEFLGLITVINEYKTISNLAAFLRTMKRCINFCHGDIVAAEDAFNSVLYLIRPYGFVPKDKLDLLKFAPRP